MKGPDCCGSLWPCHISTSDVADYVCNCIWTWAACCVAEVGYVMDKYFWPLHVDGFAKFSVSCDCMPELIQSDSLQSCHARVKRGIEPSKDLHWKVQVGTGVSVNIISIYVYMYFYTLYICVYI